MFTTIYARKSLTRNIAILLWYNNKRQWRKMMSYIHGTTRDQCTISTLDEQIDPTNPVRLIDWICDLVLLEDIEKYTIKGKSRVGRPAYHPKHMLKLYVYGYMNKIASSRRLEAECRRNIELKWLINNVCPDFKTIADFRSTNSDAIKELTLRVRYRLVNQGLITGELMALDGTKIKANAGANEISYEEITRDLQEIEAKIEGYFNLLRCNDLADELTELNVSSMDSEEMIAGKIAELQKRQQELQTLHNHASESPRKKVNPTDPESRMIRSRKESFSGYNLQIIVDSMYKLIASAQVRQSNNDRQEMIPALENLKDTMDMEPSILLADNGYENVAMQQKIEAEGKTEALVNITEEKVSGGSFGKWSFDYDEELDCYRCPTGHLLKRRGGIQVRKGRKAVVYQSKKKVCAACPSREKCSKSKSGRTITRFTDEKWVEEYRKKVCSPANKALQKRRKAIVEHVFGVLKCWMGKIPLLLRGQKKVQTEINLYTTAYNLKRLIKILGFDKVKSMIMRNWREGTSSLDHNRLLFIQKCA